MLCQKCGKEEAKVTLKRVINKEKQILHLCKKCAQEQPKCIEEPAFAYSIQHILAELLKLNSMQIKESNEFADVKCEKCGMTYSKFRETGRFGCSNDFRIFSKQISNILKKVQSADRHCGKIPVDIRGKELHNRELKDLKAQLKKVVEIENYEEAAIIRDKIKELEGKGYGAE